MMLPKYLLLLSLFSWMVQPYCKSQNVDDSLVLTYTNYINNVITQHPAAQKAALTVRSADAERMRVKGVLDPKLVSSWKQKNFKEKLYYRIQQHEIKLNSRYGIALSGRYFNTSGDFLNPENYTPTEGLWSAGLEVDVLQGLIRNERNIDIQQANVLRDASLVDQQLSINKLLYEAAEAYVKWAQLHYYDTVLQKNLFLSSQYLINTKTLWQNGEKTRLDTLEAFISFQTNATKLIENDIKLLKAQQQLQTYLWQNGSPVTLHPAIIPEDNFAIMGNTSLGSDIIALVTNHPEIQQKRLKQQFLQTELKLKKEKFKPKLKLKYNHLLAGELTWQLPELSQSNYSFGMDFSYPLFLRSARGDLEKTKVKLMSNRLEINDKSNQLNNKISASFQELDALNNQMRLVESNIEGYKQLLDGENEKFTMGESSFFILNKRQEKYMESQLKLIELKAKRQKATINLLYYTGDMMPSGQNYISP